MPSFAAGIRRSTVNLLYFKTSCAEIVAFRLSSFRVKKNCLAPKPRDHNMLSFVYSHRLRDVAGGVILHLRLQSDHDSDVLASETGVRGKIMMA